MMSVLTLSVISQKEERPDFRYSEDQCTALFKKEGPVLEGDHLFQSEGSPGQKLGLWNK